METFQSLIKAQLKAQILPIEKAVQNICKENVKLNSEISKNKSCIEDFNKCIVSVNALLEDIAKLKDECKELIEKIKLEEVKPVRDAYCNVLQCRLDQIFQKEGEIRNSLSTFPTNSEENSSQDSQVPVFETAEVSATTTEPTSVIDILPDNTIEEETLSQVSVSETADISAAETESNSDMEILMPDNNDEETLSSNIQTEAGLDQDRRKVENNMDVNTSIITKEEPKDDNEREVDIIELDNYSIIKFENVEFDVALENNSTKPTERIQKLKPKKRKRKFGNILKMDECESKRTKILKKVGQTVLDPEPDRNSADKSNKTYQEHASIEELLQEDCDAENNSEKESSPQDVDNHIIRGVVKNIRKKKRRMPKCNCKGCQTDPCGICVNCMDKVANGGKGTKRQRCQKRLCLEKGRSESKHVNKDDGDGQQNGEKENLHFTNLDPQDEENFKSTGTVHINENERGGRGHKRYVFHNEGKIDFIISQSIEKLSEKEIKCRKCDKIYENDNWQYKSLQQLRNHIETHLTGFTHCCPKCSFKTHTRNNMITHLQRHE